MNLLAWNLHESGGLWLFVLTLPVLLIQARRSGDDAGANLILSVLAGVLVVILVVDPKMLVALLALPWAVVVLLVGLVIGWIRQL